MTAHILKFPLTLDPRGDLLAIELSQVPFQVKRMFFIVNSPGRVERGLHRAGCRQLAVLISGKASFELSGGNDKCSLAELKNPGDAVLIDSEDYVRYFLENEHSKIAVLAEKSYASTLKGR